MTEMKETKETKKTTAEKLVGIFAKRKAKPKSDGYGFGALKAHLDEGEAFVTYSVAREEENVISHVCHRVKITVDEKAKADYERAKASEPTPSEPDDGDWQPMGVNEFGDLLDEGKAFVIMKSPNGEYIFHEVAEVSGKSLMLTEPKGDWGVLALGEYVDEHPDESHERWWLEGDDGK